MHPRALASTVCRGGAQHRSPWRTPRLLGGFFAAVGGLTLGSPSPKAADQDPSAAGPGRQPPRCQPVNPHGLVPASAAIDTGEYTLTMVAGEGPSAGASVTGRLWLVSSTTARDSQILSGAHAPLGGTARMPLYGASNADLFGVSALVTHGTPQPEPRSDSFDPLHPGVIVSHLADGDPTWVLLIGTTANNRARCDSVNACSSQRPESGPGVALEVHKITPNGFAGVWHTLNQGSANAAKGYFCASPTQFSPQFKSQTGHIAQPDYFAP